MSIQKKRKKKASAVERKIASDLGGRTVFNSGAGMEKGDAKVPHRYQQAADGNIESTTLYAFRIESKHTSTHRYTLSAQDWANVVAAGLKAGEHALFHIKIDSSLVERIELVVIPTHLFEELSDQEAQKITPDVVKSVQLSAVWWRIRTRTQGISHGDVPHVRLLMSKPSPKRGDVCVLEYTDFKRLLAAKNEGL